MKKLLLELGAISAIVTPILAVVSCDKDHSEKYIETNIAKVKELSKTYSDKIEKAIKDKKIAKGNMLLITAGGKVNDASFNQSTWEAISILSNQLNNKASNYSENIDAAKLGTHYSNAINQDAKYWILTGFQQKSQFQTWLKNADNKKQFIDKKIIVISVDWTPDEDKIPNGQSISLNFKTEQAGWIVGYAAAQYVAETYSKLEERILSGFGGGPFPGVTDFLSGYLTGIEAYNTDNISKKVKFVTGNKVEEEEEIILNTGFNANNVNEIQIQKIVETKAKIILPVAGNLTKGTMEAIKKNTGIIQNMIGVDSDQSLAFPEDKKLIFSSIEKKLGTAVYKTLASLYLKDYNFLDGFVPVGNDEPMNINIEKGISEDFVGVSKTTIESEKATSALKNANDKFEKEKSQIIKNIDLVLFSAANEENSINKLLNDLIKKINN